MIDCTQWLTSPYDAVAVPAAIIVAILAIVIVLSYAKLPQRLLHLAQQQEAAALPGKAEAPLEPLFREMPVVLLQQNQQVWNPYLSQLCAQLHRSLQVIPEIRVFPLAPKRMLETLGCANFLKFHTVYMLCSAASQKGTPEETLPCCRV